MRSYLAFMAHVAGKDLPPAPVAPQERPAVEPELIAQPTNHFVEVRTSDSHQTEPRDTPEPARK